VAEFIEPFRVKPGSKVALAKDFDPSFKREEEEGRHRAARERGAALDRVSGATGSSGHLGDGS
jgi:hypothetical protein